MRFLLLSLVALVSGNLDEATDLLHSALARFEAAGYRIDEIRCRIVLAEVSAALGALDASKAELDIAVAVAIDCEAVWREAQHQLCATPNTLFICLHELGDTLE